MKVYIQVRIELPQIKRSLILAVLTLLLASSASATDLSGKVTEVIDGNTISLKSLSHTIKVRLLAAVPPEKGQPYADVAKKHLSDLVLDKYVVVRYTGIGEQGYLVGRILLEQADINAQMLRDGVAWYYQPEARDLSESDRELYLACENAARAERRGLWQAKDPVSPWEFRKAENQNPSANTGRPVSTLPTPTMDGLTLSREGPMGAFSGPPVLLSKVSGKSNTAPDQSEKWMNLKLPAASGSFILVPSVGLRNAARMPLPDGRIADFETYVGRSGRTAYFVMSSTAPYRSTDGNASVLDATVEGFMAAVRADYRSVGGSFTCEASGGREARLNPYYTGRQYDLTGCAISGNIRIYTIWWRRIREVHLVAAFNLDGKEEPGAKTFFQSLNLIPLLN